MERTVHGSRRVPRRIAEGRASALTFFPAGSANVRSFGADRARCGRRSARIGAALSSRTRIFPYISRRRPRTPDERPTGANPERRESRPGSAPECSAPPRESLSASRLWSKAEERAPLARALRNGRAAHNSGGGIAARMHLGARSAPTAETLTRHLFRSLPLPWISPPFPGGKGAGGEWARRGRSTGRAVRFFALRGVRARAHLPRAFSRVL